jgi:plasmid maintenance system antidote protein VapI
VEEKALDSYRFCEYHLKIDMAKKQHTPPATLQEWMEREGVNATELARRAKILPSLLSMILRGSRRCSIKTAVKLNAVTGVPVENIIQWPKVPLKRSFLEVA